MKNRTKKQSLKSLPREKWKELKLKRGFSTKRYAVSTSGRIASFDDALEDGHVLKHGLVMGYPCVSIGKPGKRLTLYIHRLMAEYFLNQPSQKHTFVIHKDHKKENNLATNLKWVTHEQQINHSKMDPNVINRKGYKLTEEKVRAIKIKLFQSKKQPSLKALGKKFGVSDMQIFRIKTGENWSRVKI